MLLDDLGMFLDDLGMFLDVFGMIFVGKNEDLTGQNVKCDRPKCGVLQLKDIWVYFASIASGNETWLVGGLEHFLFFHLLVISSSQLTLTPSFFRGVGQPPTRWPWLGHEVPQMDLLWPSLVERGNCPRVIKNYTKTPQE